MKINYSALVTQVSDDVQLVGCVFSDSYSGGVQKEYFYKTVEKLEVGDFVAVECTTTGSSYGSKIVKVKSLDQVAEANDEYATYKWVICKVDLSKLEVLRKQEAALIAEVKKLQAQHQKKVIREAMGINMSINNLLSFTQSTPEGK